jgi:Flp pilus assembly protein TadD
MAEVLVRIATALTALVIAAALGVELRAQDLLANAKQVLVQPHPTAADVDQQLHDLKTVRDLRPGSQADLAAAGLEFRLGRYRAAAEAAKRATKREPDNFSAWTTLAVALGATGDKAGARVAGARAHTLNPFYSPTR